MYKRLLLFSFLLFGLLCNAKLFKNERTYQVYEQIQLFNDSLDWPTISKTVSKEAFTFLQVQEAWWKIMRGHDKDAQAKRISKLCMPYLETEMAADDMSQPQLFVTTMAHGFMARVQLLKDEQMAAASNYLDGVSYLESCMKLETPADEILLLVSLYDAIIGSLNEKMIYKPILFFFPSGDKEKGLKQLKVFAAQNEPLIQTESLYFLYKLNTEFYEKHRVALSYMQQLADKYPKNWVYRVEAIRLRSFYDGGKALSEKAKLLKDLQTWPLSNNEKQYARSLLIEG